MIRCSSVCIVMFLPALSSCTMNFEPKQTLTSTNDIGSDAGSDSGLEGASDDDSFSFTTDRDEDSETGRGTPDSDQDGDGICDSAGGDPGWINESVPYASGAAASAVLSDGLHYLGGSSNFFGNTIYKKHHVYDSVSRTWESSPAEVPDGDAWGARAHVYQDRMYLIGGYPSGSRMRVYNPQINSWSPSKPPPKAFYWGFASGIIGQGLYIFGGEPHSARDASGYKYDFAAKSWSSVAPIPHNEGRGALSSAVVGDKMFVLNGNKADGTTILQIYDSATDSWSLGPSLSKHLFEAAAAAVLGSSVYFFGGARNHDISDSSSSPAVLSDHVNAYDTVSGTWSTCPPMSRAKMWATSRIYQGKIYVLGGLNAKSGGMKDLGIYTP